MACGRSNDGEPRDRDDGPGATGGATVVAGSRTCRSTSVDCRRWPTSTACWSPTSPPVRAGCPCAPCGGGSAWPSWGCAASSSGAARCRPVADADEETSPNPASRVHAVELGRPANDDRTVGPTRMVRLCVALWLANRGARIQTSCAVVVAPTLDRAFAEVVLHGRVRQAEAVGGRLLRPGVEDGRHDQDLSVRGASGAWRGSRQPPRRGQPLIATLDRDLVGC